MKKYMVKSIFGSTLQGEGTFAGRVVKFLRFAGCNKWNGLPETKSASVCSYCDTNFRGGEPLTAYQICERLKSLPGETKRVVISGGEPTLQLDLELVQILRSNGFLLHLETNGSRAIGNLSQYFEHVTMSPKQTLFETKLEFADDLKILYPPPAPGIDMEGFAAFNCKHRYLQPIAGATPEISQDNLSVTIKALYSNPDWALSLQTHKILGVE